MCIRLGRNVCIITSASFCFVLSRMGWFAMYAESAVRGCSSLFDIIIPDSVTSIGNEAFLFCNSLHSLVLPDGVSSIGDSAFRGCTSLTDIVIPDSVAIIGDRAFKGCYFPDIEHELISRFGDKIF